MTIEKTADADLAQRSWEDPQRPRFHFVSPGGWLNDPNGVGQWGGTYHLFYQYNPHAPVHSRIHWGHATSTDLVHWTDEPVALVPGDGPDAEGCWSGVLVDDGGVPTLVYSGHLGRYESACIATGSPDLRRWTRDPANPVIAGPPAGLDVTAFRDHCVWREGETWHQLIGSGIRDVGGAALHYTSPDLRDWTYQGPYVVGDAEPGGSDTDDFGPDGVPAGEPWTGTMWECVDRIPLDGTEFLAFSAWDEGVTHYPLYTTVSTTASGRVPGRYHHLDYGMRHFYAPQSMVDERGRRIMYGWMQEARGDAATAVAGWSGVMSLPRELTLAPDGTIHQGPVAEVASLRAVHLTAPTAILGDQLDLELDVVLPALSSVRLGVRVSPDRSEQTVVRLSRDADGAARLDLDRAASSRADDLDVVPLGGPVPVGADDRVSLRVLVDHSALEVFANGRALTARVYPARDDSLGTFVEVDGSARVDRFDAWSMSDVWDGPRELWPADGSAPTEAAR